tara:strand:- start:158 stop:688 length:531 start_codon:yes stop_codon:yes gene_type:complete
MLFNKAILHLDKSKKNMNLTSTIKHIFLHYLRVSLGKYFYKLPEDILIFRKDCEIMVDRYNKLLKEISTYMKDHSKNNTENSDNSSLILSYQDTDTFHIISIKEDLAVLTDDCEELLEKEPQNPSYSHLHKEANKNYINQLHELRQYSVQIETALNEYEKNIMKIEEEISNETLCN